MKNLRLQIRFTSLLAIASLAVTTLAVSPPPDGGYANENTAEGDNALFSLTTGFANTAVGFNALYSNTDGINNTTIGSTALFNNSNGYDNTATGFEALLNNTTGFDNTAIGAFGLFTSTTGSRNTASGVVALYSNTTGWSNTANGFGALSSNTTGLGNTAIGGSALVLNTTGDNNIGVGIDAGKYLTTGNSNIDIGSPGVLGESKTIRIGKRGTQTRIFIAGVSGAIVPTGVAVIVDANGHLGTTTSSARFKDGIKPMDKASAAILALKPVTFRYKKEHDPAGIPQFGLVAEEVAKVNPDLVARDEQGKPYTVRYEAVNAMLLNEFLKEHRKVESLEAIVAAQQKGLESQQKKSEAIAARQQQEIQVLAASLKEQAAQIQKVNARLEADKAAPRVVSNDRLPRGR